MTKLTHLCDLLKTGSRWWRWSYFRLKCKERLPRAALWYILRLLAQVLSEIVKKNYFSTAEVAQTDIDDSIKRQCFRVSLKKEKHCYTLVNRHTKTHRSRTTYKPWTLPERPSCITFGITCTENTFARPCIYSYVRIERDNNMKIAFYGMHRTAGPIEPHFQGQEAKCHINYYRIAKNEAFESTFPKP